jgi:hypothetical protein
VNRDEVAGSQQLVERDAAHPELGGPGSGHIRVVGDQLGAEGGQPLSHQGADAPETDDADGLLVDLGARVLAALPLPALERLVSGRDVPGRGEQEPNGQLGCACDVGRGRVDDHDAGLSGGLDVDVVQPDTGPGDDFEVRRRGDGLRVDLGGATDQDGVRVGDGGQ